VEVKVANPEEVLQKVPLFHDLQPKDVRSLARFTVTRTFEAGQVIVAEGQMGFGLYCIQSGKVRITQNTPNGTREIRTMGPDESFGEISLIDEQPRTATVTAIEPTTAVVLDKMQFASEVRNHPEVAFPMMRSLVQWLRDADHRIAELT
jgi:CRP/FNR family transcriptional regulator, cyclic AMP receptor protein